jgi:hypothetical protein
MKTFSHFSICSLLLFFCAVAHAQGFTNLPDEGEAGGYDVTAKIVALPVEWNLNAQENGDAYRLRLEPTGAELSIVSDGKVSLLASSKTTVAPGEIVIQRRGPRWNIISAERVILQAEDDRWMEGTVGFRGGSVQNARLQPVEEIVFDDDFMRVAKDVAFSAAAKADPHNGVKVKDAKIEETIWRAVVGSWATTGISEQEQAMVAQSANPFAFASKSKEENIALSGREFWSDYSVEAAVKPHAAKAIGLMLYVQDEKNYLIFDWQHDGRIQLRAVVGGASRVLVAAQTDGFDEKNWYRLKFSARGGLLRAFIDEQEILRARTDVFGRGLVGLYCNNSESDTTGTKEKTAVFDDLRVRSAIDFHDNFSTTVPGRWQTISGQWNLQNAAWAANQTGAYAVMGEGEWHDYTVSADVKLPADAAAGLVAHHIAGEGAYVFRVAGSQSKLPFAGKAQIIKIGGGQSTPLAEVAVGNRYDDTNGRWSFAIEHGYLQGTIETDGKAARVLDAWSDSNSAGRAGIYAQRGARGNPSLKDFAVEFPREKSVWASVPDIYVDPRQAETMGAWSTPEGLWLPVAPMETNIKLPPSAAAKDAKVFWHKGAFWGDQDIRFKMPALKAGQNLTLILGDVAPNQTGSTLPLSLALTATTLTKDATQLDARLSRGASETLKEGKQKFDGALEGKPIEISRRGNYVIVRVGDEDTQQTLLAAKVSG